MSPERRDDTISEELAYHVFTSVLRVIHAKYALTLSVGSSPASISLSESKYS